MALPKWGVGGWVVLVLFVGLVIWGVQSALGALGIIDVDEPIYRQDCVELGESYDDTVADLSSGNDTDRSQARLRLQQIDLRVAELGGCAGLIPQSP